MRLLLFALTTALLTAQIPEIGQAMKANTEAIRAYEHKRRTEITYKGRTRTRVDLVRYVDGQMQATPLDGGAAQKKRGGGKFAQKRAQKKIAEMRDDAAKLSDLLHQYLPPQQSLIEKAKFTRNGDAMQLTAENVVRPKDTFKLSWNTKEQRPENMEILTDLDGKPVSIAVAFARLPDGGPHYASQATLSQPQKDLTIRIENFDFTKGSAAQ